MIWKDKEGNLRSDLTDYMLFFAKSTVETAKKLNWNADYIINIGWFTSFLPLYLKTYYKDEPLLSHTETVHILVNDEPYDGELPVNPEKKFLFDDILPEEFNTFLPSTRINLFRGASRYADLLINGEEDLEPALKEIFDNGQQLKGKINLAMLKENPRIFGEIMKQFQTLGHDD